MFFFLSKTLNYLTMPLVIICLLLLVGLLIKSATWKKRLYKTGLVLLLLFSNDFLSNEVVRLWELPATPYAAIPRTYEVGILLTGVTKGNMTPDDRIYFQRGADRVTHSLQLYKLGIIKKILISGGSGMLTERTRQEADEISDVLLLMGVPAQDILIENQSRNTHESAQAVRHLLQESYTPDDCLLITSAFHMRRSRACFKKVDWPTATFSVDFLHHERKFTPDVLFVPKIEALHIWSTLIREWVGLIAYKASGYI